MQGPFPDELEPTFGSVTVRTIKGMPVWICLVLAGSAIVPLFMLGWRSRLAWGVAACCLGLASVVAYWAKDDPQFVQAWLGELRLKRYYH